MLTQIKIAIACAALLAVLAAGLVIRWQHGRIENLKAEAGRLETERDFAAAEAEAQAEIRRRLAAQHARDLAAVKADAVAQERRRTRRDQITREIVIAPAPPPDCPPVGPALAAALRGLRDGDAAPAGAGGDPAGDAAGGAARLPAGPAGAAGSGQR